METRFEKDIEHGTPCAPHEEFRFIEPLCVHILGKTFCAQPFELFQEILRAETKALCSRLGDMFAVIIILDERTHLFEE